MSVALALVVLFVATSGAGQSGCAPLSPTAADVNQPEDRTAEAARAELGVGESYRVEARAATVTFARVRDDSRCPTGVTCVWEGDAIVELVVGAEGGQTAALELHANQRFPQEAAARGLRVRLERLEPYPEADRPIPAGDYRVVLLVSIE